MLLKISLQSVFAEPPPQGSPSVFTRRLITNCLANKLLPAISEIWPFLFLPSHGHLLDSCLPLCFHVGDIANIRCMAVVVLQLHSKAFKGWRSPCMAEKVGAVDSCAVMRADFVLTGCKEKEEGGKKLCVYYCDLCKSPFFVCNYRENIPWRNGTGVWTCLIHQHPCEMWGWWWCFEVLCLEGLDDVAEGIPAAPLAETDEKRINSYCENRLKTRRDLCDLSVWLLLNTRPHKHLFW